MGIEVTLLTALVTLAVLAGASAMVAVRTIAHVFSVSERTAKYYRAAAKITDVFPSPGKHK